MPKDTRLQAVSPLIQKFYPSLDGLRAVAFLLVACFHSFISDWGAFATSRWSVVPWGWVGVDLFFVLSGFLITGILYDSLDRADYFKTFYIRRSLRIFPLYFGFWVVILLLTPVLHVQWNRYMVTMVFYMGNLFMPGSILQLHGNPAGLFLTPPFTSISKGFGLGHLWSLCVEEQFYLVWPAAVWLLRSRRSLLAFCVLYISIAPFARAFYLHIHPEALNAFSLYLLTPFRADALLAGAALALWLRGPAPAVAKLKRYATMATVGAPSVLALCVWLEATATSEPLHMPVVVTFGLTLVAIAGTGLLLLALVPGTLVASTLRWPWLSKLGRLSYGLYFFHDLIFQMMIRLPHVKQIPFRVTPLITMLITILAAYLSFRFFEAPFLRLKPALAPEPEAEVLSSQDRDEPLQSFV